MTRPDWQWNEMQQVGTDYADLAQVEAYDHRMGSFRDVAAENREDLAKFNLPSGSWILEIGCGTGRFARAAAAAGMNVTAIDVSPIMLEFIKKKAADEGLPPIATQHSGFLTMDLPAAHFDAALSGAALHHLPDAWKLVALRNVARVLKQGGQFILRDVVFAVPDGESPEPAFEHFAGAFPNMRVEAARHVAQEFSTYDWIMEGLLQRAGFEILSRENPSEGFLIYHCRKL
ncbi:class I SAM-dependent methyltransferase [bacterium]|nr:class I SAM-dependent methyltransferase [bacterium]